MTIAWLNRLRADSYYDWPPEPACLGCGHYRPIHSHGQPGSDRGLVCHYLLDTGHSRGCPFGPGCTRWED